MQTTAPQILLKSESSSQATTRRIKGIVILVGEFNYTAHVYRIC